MDWSNVRKGDTVTVEIITGLGGTVTGELGYQGATAVAIGELTLSKGSLKIIDHKPGYKDGDIGTYTNEATGATYVGIYSQREEAFMDSTYRAATKAFYSYHKGIKIVGNIKELA